VDRETVVATPAATKGLTEDNHQYVDAGTEMEAARVTAISGGEAIVYGIENGNARVVLRATKEVWIRVEDGEGNVMLNQTLRPGDSYRVPDKDGIWLVTKDAGAITGIVDGSDVGPLGASGEVLVGRPLDPESLLKQQKADS